MRGKPKPGTWFVCETYPQKAHMSVIADNMMNYAGKRSNVAVVAVCGDHFGGPRSWFHKATDDDARCHECVRVAKLIAEGLEEA